MISKASALAILTLMGGMLLAAGAQVGFASTSPNWTTGLRAVPPGNAGADPNPSLNAITCPSAGNCVVVGYYTDSAGHTRGLLLVQSSDVWSDGIEAPLPIDAGTDPSVSINAVSCVSAGNCVAVGRYRDSAGHSQGLLLTQSSGAWTAAKAPLPGDSAADPSASLNGVSCASAKSCAAVGSYKNASGEQGLVLDEDSGSWTAAKVTPPGDAGANPLVSLDSVSCPAAGNCVAIGSYRDSFTQNQVLLTTESSGAWSAAAQPPLPSDATTGGGHGLRAVSCPSVGNCAVTGYYYDSSIHTQGLLLSEFSGTWTAQKAALPSDAGTDPSANVVSVSCPATGECSAGGYYNDASGHEQALLVNESAGAWAGGIEALLPPDVGADPGAEIAGVSCTSPGTCSAAGFYRDASAHIQGLLLSESAGSWSTGIRASLPGDAGTNPFAELSALSCASAGSCTAINSYEDNSGHGQGLLVSAAPASPALSLSAPPEGAVGRELGPAGVGAALSGGASPLGTITFTVFGPQPAAPGSCSSGGALIGAASVSGDGTYRPPAGFTPTRSGHYWWYAAYGGDTSDNPAASACGASMAETVVTAPLRLTHLTQSHRRWRRGNKLPRIARSKRPPLGTTFGFTLSKRARVRFSFAKQTRGRRAGRRCVLHRRKGRRCTRLAKPRTLVLSGHAGRNRVRFQGRISKRRRLKPGSYKVTVTAADSSGQRSAARSLRFTIV